MLEAERERTAVFVSALAGAERVRRLSAWTRVFVCGEREVDVREMGRVLRDELGVRRMMCLGGPRLNATLIEAGAVDELFLTLAPKFQGGRGWATAVEGVGFPAEVMPRLELVSMYENDGELYLRYRLPRTESLVKSES